LSSKCLEAQAESVRAETQADFRLGVYFGWNSRKYGTLHLQIVPEQAVTIFHFKHLYGWQLAQANSCSFVTVS
jgi:hypothetical protein